MVKIIGVDADSLAARAGIRAGDYLISIDGHDIRDVLDYRFFLAEKKIRLLIHRDADLFDVEIRKRMYDDIGLSFETPLMDQKHRCENKCIFCFIDQLPGGMRPSLYFKDDDSRLSFLHGNYITLTNLRQHDVDRIIEMHISPVNISIHTTNPELRVKMMHNRRAGEVLGYIRQLADAGISLRGQIVLCRGINDGEELTRTLTDLTSYYPALDSVSVVPAGLTGHREGLYPLEPFTPEECAEVIGQVDRFGEECLSRFGERIFYCSDEFYLRAGIPIPPYEYWGDFSQIENGVGMIASMGYEFDAALEALTDEEKALPRRISVATGEAAFDFISGLVVKAKQVCYNMECTVYCVENRFFGGLVTVAGLLTGKDLAEQLVGKPLGEELLLPRTTLRAEGDLFLCGMTPEQLSSILNVRLRFSENDGAAFLDALLGEGGDVRGTPGCR
jgi:putative radical SAM enzyme (TIGR03279 family)